jgi:transcriptional antiterminator NusG
VPNVLGFLSVTKDMKPAPVRPADINKLFGKIEEVDEMNQLEEAYLVGEKVKVIEGPFNGFTGTIEEVQADKKKLKVIVVIFDRQTPLELAFNQVEKE